MGTQFAGFEDNHRDFIAAQQMFFVATAGPDGKVNLSPKGMDSLRVMGPNRVLWRNLTGSGNETAGHLRENPRMTVMWCSFITRPMILRAYGTARMVLAGGPGWDALNGLFPAHLGARQVYDMDVEMVQESCGYAVPFMDFVKERDTLSKWAEDRGPEAIRTYWGERNAKTLDGKPTGFP